MLGLDANNINQRRRLKRHVGRLEFFLLAWIGMSEQSSIWREDVHFKKRNQHFIPQFWQREFKDTNGYFYVRYSLSADPRNERDPNRGKAFEESTKNTFTDDYTYTVSDPLFQPYDVLEDLLSAEEGKMKQAHEQVLKATGSITSELRKAFCRSIALAACRLPHVMERGHRRLKDLVYCFAEIHDLDRAAFDKILGSFGVALSDDEYELLKARPEDRLISTALGFGDLSPQDPDFPMQYTLVAVSRCAQDLTLMDITILESLGSPSYILGDTPIPDSDLAMGFTLPLGRTVAVRFSAATGNQSFSRRVASPIEVAAINQEQYNNSVTHVIGPDPAYLNSLVS
jgi:hypothetical protein